jgi:hypothetical protein
MLPYPGSFTVGKDPGNALVIQDRFISGRHLQASSLGRARFP